MDGFWMFVSKSYHTRSNIIIANATSQH